MSEPIRILHAVVNLNRGGAETLLMNLYRKIDRSKIQFDFLTSIEGVYEEEVKQLGGRVYRIPYITKVGPFGYAKALRQFFQSHPEYTIVHSHMDKMSGLVLREAKKAGVPVRIAHSHSTQSEGDLLNRLIKDYYGRFLVPSATHCFACSEAAAQWLFGDSKTIFLKNGIDTNKYVFSESIRRSMREELDLTDGITVVGHIGRFSEPKNHQFIIEVFNEYHKKNPNSVLLLAGDGGLRPQIEQQVEETGLQSSVKFLGVREDVPKLLQAMDIFVFPSLYEGLPVSLVEAQASGLPCVISDRIPQEAVLLPERVRTLPLGDAQQWAQNLQEIPLKRTDEIQNICNAGYDISTSAAELQEFYISVQEE